MWRHALIAILLLAGCGQLPPSPRDIQAKKFETLSDRAVIYVFRDDPDFVNAPVTIELGDDGIITTYPGTYYRWETAPGVHRISGHAGSSFGEITLKTEAGKLYFVQQWVLPFSLPHRTDYSVVAEPAGRAAVGRAELLGGR